MLTIRDVLSRIQWDREFGAAEFVLVYADRFTATHERVDLAHVRLETGNWFSFEVHDTAGTGHSIPFHRIREVYRNGERIWARPERSDGPP